MNRFYSLLKQILFKFDAERVHDLALKILSLPSVPSSLSLFSTAPSCPVSLWNLTFRNPVGLAAGFDKNAVALSAWYELGFGFCEVGTVTLLPQEGNPKPRIFRLVKEKGLVNSMGFPNDGAEIIAKRIAKWKKKNCHHDFPIGINIGKSRNCSIEDAEKDYLESFRILYSAGDFFVVNVSSPNTPGLRKLQTPSLLEPILTSLQKENIKLGQKPLLIKIAPDLNENEIFNIAELTSKMELNGIVATNTTMHHDFFEGGGLSGAPLYNVSNRVLSLLKKKTENKIALIGVGGIMNKNDFLEKIKLGSDLVEVYSGLVYNGPNFVRSLLA